MRRRVSVIVVVAVLLAATSCAAAAVHDAMGLRIMVPNSSGSGYDVTARTAARAMEDAGIVPDVEVFNLPGSDGTVGLQRLVYERGNENLLMVMGLGVVGSQYAHRSRATLEQTTPIARLIEEPNIIVVTNDSPFQTLGDLVRAWLDDPSAVRVGGGSAVGGPDHLAAMLIAQAVGVAPHDARYERYDGGGALLAAILGKRVSFGVSGVAEIIDQVNSHQLRVLGVTSGEPLPGLAAPTLREAGVDVIFTNWRGVVAPPGLTPREVATLRAVVDKLHASDEWQQALARNAWRDAYLTGGEFTEFVRSESERVERVLLDLGLADSGR